MVDQGGVRAAVLKQDAGGVCNSGSEGGGGWFSLEIQREERMVSRVVGQ